MKTQCKWVKRRMSRTETGRSFVYSAVQQGNNNRKKSIHLANQKVHGKDDSVKLAEPEVFF